MYFDRKGDKGQVECVLRAGQVTRDRWIVLSTEEVAMEQVECVLRAREVTKDRWSACSEERWEGASGVCHFGGNKRRSGGTTGKLT